ncbi:MAG: hypothetical protein JOZ22_05115 [Acidobacteriia bacterium]|nr:hypothetical protein [Terriglobia bacterium]
MHDSSGSAPHDTPFGRALKGREDPTRLTAATPLTGSLVYLEMRPGQILTDSVNLSRLHDLTQPGKYVIQAKAFDIESKRMVESNKITVTVTK